MAFQKATKKQIKARVALSGPAGSGKTYTSLAIATALGRRVAVIDTERKSASKYADRFDFDVNELEEHSIESYVQAINDAAAAGYDVLVIDSMSHEWVGRGGALETVDKLKSSSRTGNAFTDGWSKVTPKHNLFIDAVLAYPGHVIATMRNKMAYEIVEENGKKKPVKLGLQPIQRDGVEYEFDVVGDLSVDNVLTITKSRCSALAGKIIEKPGKQVADALAAWLSDGAPAPEAPPAPPPPAREPHPLEEKIAAAGTAAALDALVAEIGRLPVADKDYLRPLFEARMAELRS